MKCTEFKQNLDDGIDQELSATGQVAFDAHRASCADCEAIYRAEMAMLDGLRAMPVPAPSADFADRVLANTFKQKASPQHSHHHRQGFLVGFGSAAAAALALWVVVGMPPEQMPEAVNTPEQSIASNNVTEHASPAKQPVLSIALNTRKTVKLAFASSEALTGARITIRLPENVALVGYPGRRELSWETSLKKGDNLLSLPVIATQVARGELVADIEYKGQMKTLRLNLETRAAKTPSAGIEFTSVIG